MQNNINDSSDRYILDLIKADALAEAPKPDFEDLKKRIAALAPDADKGDGLGYRDMFPAEKKPSMIRYAAAAAAVIAVAGIGAAAARNIFSGGNMASEASYSADSASMYEDAMEVPAEAFMDEAEETAEDSFIDAPSSTTYPADAENAEYDDAPYDGAAYNVMTEEAAPAVNEADIADNYENGEKNGTDVSDTDTPESAAQNSTALSEENEELYDFYVKDLGITIGVPYQAFCTGPDVPDNFPPLERFDMTAEQLEKNYKSRGICFNAVWYDEDGADVIEIVVSREDVSDKINNLSSLSEYEMEQLRQSYMRYGIDSPDSPRYYDVSVVNLKGQPYIRALGKDYAGKACHAQYMTIVNGRRVKLSLIEHFSEAVAIPEDGVSPAHVSLMDNVAASVRYDRIRSNFAYRLSRLRPTVWVSLLGILVLIIYGVHYLIERRKHLISNDGMPDNGMPDDGMPDSGTSDSGTPEYGLSDGDQPPAEEQGDHGLSGDGNGTDEASGEELPDGGPAADETDGDSVPEEKE